MPTHVNVLEIEGALRRIPGVQNVHELHVWSITPGRGVLVVHLAVAPQMTFSDVAKVLATAEEVVCGGYDIHHVTIQVEPDAGNLHCQPCTFQDSRKPHVLAHHPAPSPSRV